ncbi:MAG: zinc-dependent alcohol dehydrogenase family protein [SAR324 cluster bacterium]|nr:zinc-dependent alcohol dehydrogenase family protein [SAR324 cluster bacterium]
MKAMILKRCCSLETNRDPLEVAVLPDPCPVEDEILLKVNVCGVCHTELDEIEGRVLPPKFPLVLGHQVVGRVAASGPGASNFGIGERVGVAWIHSVCGVCKFCSSGTENLCRKFIATGRDVNGGYAQYMTVSESFVYRIPQQISDSEAAPLLCAGAIGYRSLHLTGLVDGQNLGLVGFGASAHLILKMVRYRFRLVKVFVFARNAEEREFSRELGAVWAGDISEVPPEKMDCIIDTTPVWKPVLAALNNLEAGGRLVINAIRKEKADKDTLLQLDYANHLWREKEIKSVANVCRRDVSEFLTLAAEMEIKPEIQEFPLEQANRALLELRTQKIRGAKVLRIA